MIDAAGTAHNRALAEGIVSSVTRSSTPQSQTFRAELSDKLAHAAGTATNPAAGQRIVTWRDPISASGSTSLTTAGTSQPSGLNGLVIAYPSSAAGAAGSSQQALSQPMSFDQAYWASQPAAVQQLQDIQDPSQRTQVAEQLAQQGYSIDVPIMVWGWDAATTTAARQSMGYTWVPSAQQQPVESAPGVTFAGTTPYDPTHPPAGSITV
ncbi:MAG: hypothetical protein ABSG13_00125 [Bryobacteraceae bacterium]